jgi:hypothetical protein
VECTVWRGTEIVKHTYLEERESVFSGEITGLAPDSTYSILLLGRVNSSTVVARGYQYDISVEVNVVTEVMVGWFSFQPTLISPEDGIHFETGLPALEWNSVNGAQIYMLKVDDDIRFLSPELQENVLYETSFTPTNSLPIGTYYWKIACRDHLGNTGRWSDIWMFTIE